MERYVVVGIAQLETAFSALILGSKWTGVSEIGCVWPSNDGVVEVCINIGTARTN